MQFESHGEYRLNIATYIYTVNILFWILFRRILSVHSGWIRSTRFVFTDNKLSIFPGWCCIHECGYRSRGTSGTGHPEIPPRKRRLRLAKGAESARNRGSAPRDTSIPVAERIQEVGGITERYYGMTWLWRDSWTVKAGSAKEKGTMIVLLLFSSRDVTFPSGYLTRRNLRHELRRFGSPFLPTPIRRKVNFNDLRHYTDTSIMWYSDEFYLHAIAFAQLSEWVQRGLDRWINNKCPEFGEIINRMRADDKPRYIRNISELLIRFNALIVLRVYI